MRPEVQQANTRTVPLPGEGGAAAVDVELPFAAAQELPRRRLALDASRAGSVDIAIPLSTYAAGAVPDLGRGAPRMEDVAAHPSRLRVRWSDQADAARRGIQSWNWMRTGGAGLSELAARGL